MELTISIWVYENLHTPLLDALMPAITSLADNGFIWLLCAVCLLIFPQTRRAGLTLCTALLLVMVINNMLLKNLFARARPCAWLPKEWLLIPAPDPYSFPSGHSAISFAGAYVISLYHKKAGMGALVLALLIAFSRVYLLVHYPTDVLAGAFLGVFCAVLAKRFMDSTCSPGSLAPPVSPPG